MMLKQLKRKYLAEGVKLGYRKALNEIFDRKQKCIISASENGPFTAVDVTCNDGKKYHVEYRVRQDDFPSSIILRKKYEADYISQLKQLAEIDSVLPRIVKSIAFQFANWVDSAYFNSFVDYMNWVAQKENWPTWVKFA